MHILAGLVWVEEEVDNGEGRVHNGCINLILV